MSLSLLYLLLEHVHWWARFKQP